MSSNAVAGRHSHFVSFGLIVTGKAEEAFLPNLFRSVMETGKCSFRVIRRIDQRSPITSERRRLTMIGSGKTIPDKDAEDIGFPARKFLSSESNFIILVDDLESRRSGDRKEVFDRYRRALDTILRPNQAHRASVHFFVFMLEAYYFADAQAVNQVLGTTLEDFEGDVETIENPKINLKRLYQGFGEIEDGRKIVTRLDMRHVLSREDTCSYLRAMFAWIFKVIGEPEIDEYKLACGQCGDVTMHQVDALRPAELG